MKGSSLPVPLRLMAKLQTQDRGLDAGGLARRREESGGYHIIYQERLWQEQEPRWPKEKARTNYTWKRTKFRTNINTKKELINKTSLIKYKHAINSG